MFVKNFGTLLLGNEGNPGVSIWGIEGRHFAPLPRINQEPSNSISAPKFSFPLRFERQVRKYMRPDRNNENGSARFFWQSGRRGVDARHHAVSPDGGRLLAARLTKAIK